MNKKNVIIILCTAVAVVLAVVMILSFAGKNEKKDITEQNTENGGNSVSQQDVNSGEENNSNEETKNENTPVQEDGSAMPVHTEEVKVNPTFMYFVDNAQEADTASVIEELKTAYPNVVFDIINVEKNPEILNNFELVKGNTPTLIMLDTSNNICGFQFSCTDKDLLEQSIKTALGE